MTEFEALQNSLKPRQQSIVRAFALILALTTWLVPTRARAGESARLVYSRTTDASTCSDEQGLRQAVARRLGYDPFVAGSMNTVVAELRSDGDGLRARVYVIREGNSAGGLRELSSPSRDCTELLGAVALAISIAVDPDALDRVEREPATSAGSASVLEIQRGVSIRDNETLAENSKAPQPRAPSEVKSKNGTFITTT